MDSIYKNPAIVVTQKLPVPYPNADISYPVVTGLQNPAVQQKINRDILMLVYRLIAMQNAQLSSQGYTNPEISVTGWYELKTNERAVLSLTLGNYTIAQPAAHGLTFIKSLNFDTETGKDYLLSEQFKPGSDYVKRLSDIIKVQIKQRDITLLNGFEAIKPEQDYYLSDKVLVIYFQVYEIAAYVYGLPAFPISVYDIQDIIREGTPLDRVAMGD